MTITIENIEESKQTAQEVTNSLTSLLHQNIVLTPLDNKKTIARKIDALTSLKEYFLKSINTDEFSDNNELIKYMLFIENITDQIHKYEMLIGRKSIETLQRIGKRFGEKHQEPVVLTQTTTVFCPFDTIDINLMLNVLSCDSENQEFLEEKWATLKTLGDFTIEYFHKKSNLSPEVEKVYKHFLSTMTNINTYFRSLNASAINMMLNALSMRDFENQEFFEKKLATLEALKEFSIKYIDIESMSSRESKAAYIRFLSKITDNIESLEILTGKITTEQLKAASQSFARKWESAVSIID